MKNKKATYILLIAVIAIWGGVVFRIINHIRKPAENFSMRQANIGVQSKFSGNDTTISLKLNYPDPFLKYNYSAVSNNQSAQRSNRNADIRQRISPEVQIVNENIVWPEIKFSGIIFNNKTSERLGLLEINSESFLVKKGEDKNGVQIIEIYPDSIKVNYKNKLRTLFKTNQP